MKEKKQLLCENEENNEEANRYSEEVKEKI